MALSEHEQQMLKEIEQSLLSEDPKFGAVGHGDATGHCHRGYWVGAAGYWRGTVPNVPVVVVIKHPGIFSDGCRRHVDAARWW